MEAAPSEFKTTPPAKEVVASMNPRERAVNAITAAKGGIKDKYDKGFFGSDNTNPLHETAEWAQLYEGGEVNPETSRGLRGMIESLDAVTEEADPATGEKTEDAKDAQGLREVLTEHVRVKVGEGENEEFLTHEEWQARLQAATPEERVQLESQGLYGFKFPEEQAAPAQEVPKQSSEDLVITTQISTLESLIKVAQLKGESTKAQEQLLKTLRLAEQAKGELGVLLKAKALQDLKNAGVKGLDEIIAGLGERVVAAKNQLGTLLEAAGLSGQDIAALTQFIGQGLDRLIESGQLAKIQGLDIKALQKGIFGKEVSQEEMDNLFNTHFTSEQKNNLIKRYGKAGGIGLLVLLLMMMEPIVKGVISQ